MSAEVLSWPTPDAMVANDGQDAATYESRRRRRLQEKRLNGNGAGLVLSQAARRDWPTATCGDAIGAGNRNLEGSKAHAGTSLTDAVNGGQSPRTWPTPTRQDGENNAGPSQVTDRNSQPLNAQAGGALNPDWVACLMGWPVGWEDASKPLPQPVTFSPWPAPPGPQHPWEPPRLTDRRDGRAARLRMLGNGQTPATAVLAWLILGGGT